MPAFDPAWLDRMYNNRALVPEHDMHFARWKDASADAREALDARLDIAYGGGPNETLDIFVPRHRVPSTGAPIVVFIHGGYWRSLDKADHSFVASPYVDQGCCVVVPNYALCPAVTIPQICMQMVRVLAWLWHHAAEYGADRSRITVWGHSAGGHLAAMMQSVLWPQFDAALPRNLVKNSLSISGLFDLEPVRQTPFLVDSLRLTPQDALRASPARMPAPAHGDLYAVAGAQESAEFIRQNQLIAEVWGRKRVPVCEALAGLNHFSVLEALTLPGHRLQALAMERIAQI
jgi:arylformamidase